MLTFQTRFDKEGSFPSLISGEKKKLLKKKIKKINLLALFWLVCGGWVVGGAVGGESGWLRVVDGRDRDRFQ